MFSEVKVQVRFSFGLDCVHLIANKGYTALSAGQSDTSHGDFCSSTKDPSPKAPRKQLTKRFIHVRRIRTRTHNLKAAIKFESEGLSCEFKGAPPRERLKTPNYKFLPVEHECETKIFVRQSRASFTLHDR